MERRAPGDTLQLFYNITCRKKGIDNHRRIRKKETLLNCGSLLLGTRYDSCRVSAQEREHDASGDGRAYNSGDVRAHRVHQQKVPWVLLLANSLHNTRCHRHSRHSG